MIQLDSALGIEIRADRLVLATVVKGFQGFALQNYGVLEHHQELPVSESQNWVQEYLQGKGVNRQNVIVGLPRNQVVIRHVELPLEVEENLDQVVRFQAERFEPLEKEQSYYDYVVADRDERREKIQLQIVMVRRGYLDEQLTLLKDLELYPSAIRISSTGLHQAFLAHQDGYPEEESGVVIEINPRNLEFVAVMGQERFSSAAVCLEEEDLSVERMADELDRFLSQADLPGEGLSHLYVGGVHGSRFLPDFRERFPECELLWEKLKLETQDGVVLDKLMAAIGLALSGMTKSSPAKLNLIPVDRRVIAEKLGLLPTLFLAGLLLILGSAVAGRSFVQQQRLLGQIDGQIRLHQSGADQAMKLREQIDQKKAQLEELQKLVKGRQRVLLVLSELTEIIPENSFLQALNIQGDRLSLTGYSDSASSLLKVLLLSKHLSTVESRYITPDPTNKEREKFSFVARVREDE